MHLALYMHQARRWSKVQNRITLRVAPTSVALNAFRIKRLFVIGFTLLDFKSSIVSSRGRLSRKKGLMFCCVAQIFSHPGPTSTVTTDPGDSSPSGSDTVPYGPRDGV